MSFQGPPQGPPNWGPPGHGQPGQGQPSQQQQGPNGQSPYGQQGPYGQQPGYGPQQGWPGAPLAGPPQARDIGLFDKVPCPQCGMPLTTFSTYGGGGLVGMLLVSAFSSYRCATHGPVTGVMMPAQHQTMVTVRRFGKGCGGLLLLVFVIGVIVAINAR